MDDQLDINALLGGLKPDMVLTDNQKSSLLNVRDTAIHLLAKSADLSVVESIQDKSVEHANKLLQGLFLLAQLGARVD